MKSIIPAIDHLREVARRARTGEPLGDLGPWLADGLDRYLIEAPWGLSMEAAFGLETAPGQPRWWTQESRAERDEALRTLANQHFGHLDLGPAAEAIARAVTRYAAGRWRFDQKSTEMPAGYSGTPKEDLWRAMQAASGKLPTSSRQIRRILDDDRGEFP